LLLLLYHGWYGRPEERPPVRILKDVGDQPGQQPGRVQDLGHLPLAPARRVGGTDQLLHRLVAQRGQVGGRLLPQGPDLGAGQQGKHILDGGDTVRPELVPKQVIGHVHGLGLGRQLDDGLAEVQLCVGVPHCRPYVANCAVVVVLVEQCNTCCAALRPINKGS
jgi:hypothetical protein